MIDCKNCLHSGLCLHEDKAEEYIRQHKAMRDKCSLFDGEPTCNRFIDKNILDKYRKSSKPKIYTCTDNPAPKVTYNNQCEDERTITKDDDISFSVTGGNDQSYFINGVSVSRDEYMSKYVDFLKEYGLLF